MATYNIKREDTPGVFTPTGETFNGSASEAQDHVEALEASDVQGKRYAAEEVQ